MAKKNNNLSFEDAIKKAAHTPIFKKISIAEMHNIQNGKVW